MRKEASVSVLAEARMASDRFERAIEGMAIAANGGVVTSRRGGIPGMVAARQRFADECRGRA